MIASERSPWHYRILGWCLGGSIALLVYFFSPAWLHGASRAVAAYDAGALTLLGAYFAFVVRKNVARTRARAAAEDPGRSVALAIVLLSVVAGMMGAIAILGHGPAVQTAQEKAIAIGLAIVAAIAGWLLIHTTYAFRYAHLFYGDNDGTPCDSLSFPQTPEPDDYDFLYFSFVIGMTFQVSDVQINDSRMRRNALVHAMISFVYNTAILALGVNLISNIVSQH